MKMLRFNIQVFHDLVKITIRKFTVEFFYQCLTFFTGHMLVPDFLGSVIGSSADAKLDECSVIMKVINFIINAIVFAIGALCAERAGLKPSVLDGIIVYFLWCPFQIIPEIVH